jgi:hypothetical protein
VAQTVSRRTNSAGITSSHNVIAHIDSAVTAVTSKRDDLRTTGWAILNECRSERVVVTATIGLVSTAKQLGERPREVISWLPRRSPTKEAPGRLYCIRFTVDRVERFEWIAVRGGL